MRKTKEKTKISRINNRGITLIALVITIIVLLILAGVSISMVVGENGILAQASNAKIDTLKGSEEEQIGLAFNSVKMKKISEDDDSNITAVELEDELNNIGIVDIKVTGTTILKIEFVDSKNIYTLNQDGKINKYDENDIMTGVSLPEGIKVGDYVNYTPDAGTYKVADGTYGSGYTTDDGYQSFSTEIDDDALQWRILSIDENTGEIELISATVAQSSTLLYLQGDDGYNHGVDILNDLCETLYSKTINGEKVAIARSINIEDIDKKTINKIDTSEIIINSFPNLYTKEEGYSEGGISASTGLNDGIVTDGVTTYSTITEGTTGENFTTTFVSHIYIAEIDGTETETSQPDLALKDLGINTAPEGLIVVGSP